MKWIGAVLVAATAALGRGAVYDGRACGAVGDGVAKDTKAIQSAIDRAAAAGGGEVLLPAGTYLSGTIWLKSNIDFHLAAGATLLGSTDPADYNAPDAFPQNGTNAYERSSGAHLVLCVEQRNVTVRGPGAINGNGPKITLDANGRRFPRNKETYTGLAWRPSQMLDFVECEDIRIQDVSLLDSTYWTCLIHGCRRVMIRGVAVKNHPHTWNGDGIDIDASQYVTVSDCRIESADDGITLRACGTRLRHPQDLAYVTVANCFIRTYQCNAIRIGVGERDIHDAAFSNILVEEARTAVMIGNGYSNPKNRVAVRGTGVWNMRFDNIWAPNVRELALVLAQYSSEATTHDIAFSDIGCTAKRPSRIWGNAKFPFRNISFHNVDCNEGVEAVNVEGLRIADGTLREVALSPEERQSRSDDISNFRNMIW